MKKILGIILSAVVFIFLPLHVYAANVTNSDSPVGYWKTIDDVSGEAKSIIKITTSTNGQLEGTIVKLFKDPTKLCTACDGARHNKPVLGMTVLTGLKPNKDNQQQWVHGVILDPKNGKVYRCTITLVDDGQKLQVRGYIGLPLFGRSQTWLRVTQ